MKVRVETTPQPTASYDVVIRAGVLAELADRVRSVAAAERYAVIAPGDVAALYGAGVIRDLRAVGLAAELLTFEPGEAQKTRAVWAELTDRLAALEFGRDSCIIACGGGVTGDLAGFVAATYMRGVPVVQVPTTLLAMIDASVGGKTGVDTSAGKNLVGAFHQPRLVLADPLLLKTLPDAELRAGLAEAVKHGVMLDRAYFDWIGERADELLARDAAALENLVAGSVAFKAAVVAADPFETGRRAVLNFGHTIGHALERQSGYALTHGIAVAMGMVVEVAAGQLLGVTEPGTLEQLVSVLRRCDLPDRPHVTSLDQVVAATRLDKKARNAAPRCALPREIGAAASDSAGRWTHDTPENVLAAALEATSAGARNV
jgi:3-dehydroquinate synthase